MSIIKFAIPGSAVVALALFAVLAIATGIGFNEIIEGLGNLLLGMGILAVVIVIILAFLALYLGR